MRPVATFPSVLLLLATFGYPARALAKAHYSRLNTYTVRGEDALPFSAVLLGGAQLAPVYKPFGGGGGKDGKSIEQQEDPKGGSNDVPRPQVDVGGATAFVTKTVYGFLDFTTTVGSTIMVFSPKSESKGDKKVKPSATRFIVEATPTPQLPRAVPTTQRTVIASPILLQSSLSETFSAVQPVATTSTRAAKVVTAIPEPVKQPGPRPFRFGRLRDGKRPEIRETRRPSTIGERRRFEVPPRSTKKVKTQAQTQTQGGSTIVPITVTGTGLSGPTTSPLRVTPSEVVVTANQGFASLSIIDRFTNAIGSFPNNNNDDVDSPKDQRKYAINPDPIITNDGLPPTGLVTTLGGTIVNTGLTTVHETSVIGTYIKGQYAQVLLSTSRIFQSSPSVDLLSPGFETVKSVIKGSATQFIKPEMTSILPLESLFTAASGQRTGKYDDQQALTKRRGRPTRLQFKDDPFVDGLSEDDLQRSGTDLRPSFRPVASGVRRKPSRPTASGFDPTTFRPRFTPASSFRFDSLSTRTPGGSRTSPPGNRNKRPFVRRRPGAGSNRPKLTTNRKAVTEKRKETAESKIEVTTVKPTPTLPSEGEEGEETLHAHKSKVGDVWIEVATIRSMHAFRVGAKMNTRFVTFTRTFTHAIEPTSVPKSSPQVKHSKVFQTQSYKQDDLDATPLFENILDEPRDIATLPPIDIGDSNLNALLQTVTESLSTTETMLKTSVLPVMKHQLTMMHTLTQTYLITRIVTAIKTIPPVEAFDFIPENSLNEFNDKLLAEGTENDESLLPGELEYDENSGTRVKPPPGFQNDPALAALVGGQFNPDALEQQLHPELSAALKGSPQLASGQKATPETVMQATPQLSPEHLQQLAYLQLMNPYAFGGFPAALQPQVSVTSSPVTITTDVTTTTTRVLRVIFNARPIYTTLTSTEVVRTTLTTYESSTVTATPQLPFGGFPFPGMPFAAG